jgi:hypothetical protein
MWQKVIHNAYYQLSTLVRQRKIKVALFSWAHSAMLLRAKRQRLHSANAYHARSVLWRALSTWISASNRQHMLLVTIISCSTNAYLIESKNSLPYTKQNFHRSIKQSLLISMQTKNLCKRPSVRGYPSTS